jgi:hypothetical protein
LWDTINIDEWGVVRRVVELEIEVLKLEAIHIRWFDYLNRLIVGNSNYAKKM